MKKILLIAGGTGFIGYHLAKTALERDFKVILLSKNKASKKRLLKKIKYIKANVKDLKNLKKKLKIKFDYLVNLSGYVDHSNNIMTYQSHFIGCKNLALICSKKKIKHFIQIGSSMEYGKINSPQKENSNCKPLSIYGKAKSLATEFLLKLYKYNKFPVTVLRLYQIYGPNQDQNRFIPFVINSCKNDIKFKCSSGKQYRDFLYIDDLIKAIFLCINNNKTFGKIINIGTGVPIKIKDIIKTIVRIYKSGRPQYNKVKIRKEELLLTYPDITTAKRILKWTPKILFKEGLNRTIKHYNEL